MVGFSWKGLNHCAESVACDVNMFTVWCCILTNSETFVQHIVC